MAKTNKKIFISYSDDDRSKMRSLETTITKAKHFKCIIIADRRAVFTDLAQKVKDGIFECDYFIPILTKNSIGTQWINQEVGYATALRRTIIPIIDEDIIATLKGFIHKNVDLPYKFSDSKPDQKAVRRVYRKACSLLINDLLVQNNLKPKDLELENIFPGLWRNTFDSPHLKGTESPVEIREGNKYFVNGRHWFDIKDFKVNQEQTKISFTKYGLGNDKRVIKNTLQVLKLGEIYEGIEIEKKVNLPIKIRYFKM